MTPAQRRQAWKALLDNVEERTFTRGRWTVTVDDAGIFNLNGTGALRIVFTLRRDGAIVLQDDWVAVGAPPVMVPDSVDAEGVTTFRQDVREAFRSHFLEVLQGVVARRAAQ